MYFEKKFFASFRGKWPRRSCVLCSSKRVKSKEADLADSNPEFILVSDLSHRQTLSGVLQAYETVDRS